MVKERVQEVIDFATSESPYQSANKGWVAEDVYLQLGDSSRSLNSKNELANVSIFWNPIKKIILILLFVILLATIFVFSSISIAKGRINIPFSSGLLQKVDHNSNESSFDDYQDVQKEIEVIQNERVNSEPGLDIEENFEVKGLAADLKNKKFQTEDPVSLETKTPIEQLTSAKKPQTPIANKKSKSNFF